MAEDGNGSIFTQNARFTEPPEIELGSSELQSNVYASSPHAHFFVLHQPGLVVSIYKKQLWSCACGSIERFTRRLKQTNASGVVDVCEVV